MTEDGGQRTEDRGQRTEDRGQRTEDRLFLQREDFYSPASIIRLPSSVLCRPPSLRLYHQFERKREQAGSQEDGGHGEEAGLERTGIVLQPSHQIRSGEAPDGAD